MTDGTKLPKFVVAVIAEAFKRTQRVQVTQSVSFM
jgi:hypothetical protein